MKPRFELNGLNEVRAFASIIVLFHHISLFKSREFGFDEGDSIFFSAINHNFGKIGVHIFFILSGFLITFLLIQEKRVTGKINILHFYLRRVLRIWPLYFFTVFMGFVIIPFLYSKFGFLNSTSHYPELILKILNGNLETLKYYLLFLPNFALHYFGSVAGASHLWSIGVEEQFYLFWPLIFLLKNSRKQVVLILLIAAIPIYKYVLIYLPNGPNVFSFLQVIPFYWMAFGGIGAFILFYFKIQISKFFSVFKGWINLIWFSLTMLILFIPMNHFLFGFLCLIVLLIITSNNSDLKFRNEWMSRIGKISFGIYIHHPVVIFIIMSLLNEYYLNWQLSWMGQSLYICAVCLITFGISYLSFHYFEKPFIQLKDNRFKSY